MACRKPFPHKLILACPVSFVRPAGKNNCFQRRSRGSSGFSLVEVVLAMGIIAVAFIPLMGLLPIGLNTSKQAIDTTIQAQILQQMTGQAQLTGWSGLTTMCNGTANATYFDANGNVVTSASSAIYMAAFSVPANTVLPGGATTPTLDTISIYILNTRGASGATTQTQVIANTAAKKYTVFVANTGL
jgi:uncharacterized protein (TIGR02598 family)